MPSRRNSRRNCCDGHSPVYAWIADTPELGLFGEPVNTLTNSVFVWAAFDAWKLVLILGYLVVLLCIAVFHHAMQSSERYLMVSAGLLTPGVWLFASLFYRARQQRWKILLAELKSENPHG